MVLWDVALLVVGIGLLIKGSDFFVDSGSEIGKTFKISEILLGLTLVSFGTSLPELLISLNAAQAESNGIALGNVIGTNIFNICVILGIVCVVKPIKFLQGTVRKDMYMNLLAAGTLLVLMSDTFLTGATENIITRSDGIILIFIFAVFLYYTFYEFGTYLRNRKEENQEFKLTLKDIDKLTKNILLMILGLLMVYIGGDLAVDATTNLAEQMHISETFIAIMIIAVGTSLPEIFTTISAMKKDKQNIAIGNLIGSGIFNILFILGTSSIIHPIVLPTDTLIADALVFIAASIMLIIFAKSRKKYELSRAEGIALIGIYIVYAVYVIIRR